MDQFQSFKDLRLPSFLESALEQMQFVRPTPVQAEAIPAALAGHDVLATAQTGTGKTAAFGIPLLSFLAANSKKDALVLAPTRELAAQIFEVLQTMTRGQNVHGALVIGGESFGRQQQALRQGADYIVATPGRLNDHLERRTLSLAHIGFLVFDEVDRMLDMGFMPQVKQLMRQMPTDRQTLLFSATFPKEIAAFAATLLRDPRRIAIGATTAPSAQVTEKTLTTTNEGKNALILRELSDRDGKIIVFTRTKSRTDRLARMLDKQGHDVVSLHGGRTQGQRKNALERFRRGTHRILVATDLAGRGIDVEDIQHVINFDLPATREDYIHRIGRTGRCGKTGHALNFLVAGDCDGAKMLSGRASRPARAVGAGGKRFGRR